MFVALALLVLFSRSIEAASTLTLAWDPNPNPNIAGYIVYYGTTSGSYAFSSDVGNHTNFTATNLTAGQTYYFAVLAYDASGLRSPLSSEVSGTTALPAAALVTITPSAPAIAVGGSANLVAQAYDAVGNPLGNISFTWSTANAGVARLATTSGAANTVTGSGAGATTVTVSGGDQVATATVTVSPTVARISVSPSTANMKVGETVNLTAQAFDSASNSLPNVPLTWTSGNASVARLTTSSGTTVPIVAAGTGSTSVTVSAGAVSAAAAISVSPAPAVSHVTVSPASSSLAQGQTQQFVAIAYDAANAPIQGVPFTWTTSNSGVAPLNTTSGATVSVTAQAAGAATLTATASTNGTSAQAAVTVAAALPVTRVSLTPANPTVRLGWRQTMTAQGLDASNHAVPSATFTWTSSDTRVALPAAASGGVVDVIANGAGTATLTVRENSTGQTASTTIDVVVGDTLVWDTFGGTTGTALTSHWADVDMMGGAWTVLGAAAPVLDSGFVSVPTSGPASSVVYATVGTSATDVRVAASWQARSATMWGGVALRATDANNLIFAGYRASSGELAVFRVRNGTWSRLVGAPLSVAVGSTHQIEVAATGATIQVYWDGTLTLQTTDSFNKTIDRHGLAWANGIDTDSAYDSFRVTGTAVASPPPPPPPAQNPPTPPPGSQSSGPAAPSTPTVTVSAADPRPAAAPAVSAPFGLISSVSDASVVLQWSAPTSFPAVSYIVEAGSSSGVTDLLYLDTGSAAVSWVASSVSPGIYFVRVRARSSDGALSAASNETVVSVGAQTTAVCGPTPAPSGLSAAVDGSTARLSWDGGGPSVSFVVEAGSAPGASNLASFDTQSSATSYTAVGVGDGTYFVRVRATNECGARSAASNEIVLSIGR